MSGPREGLPGRGQEAARAQGLRAEDGPQGLTLTWTRASQGEHKPGTGFCRGDSEVMWGYGATLRLH